MQMQRKFGEKISAYTYFNCFEDSSLMVFQSDITHEFSCFGSKKGKQKATNKRFLSEIF